jgi:dienelactone hydrolase
LAKRKEPISLPDWPYHFELKIEGFDGAARHAVYYPPKTRFTAPILLLVHEPGAGRGAKDFQDPIESLKAQGFAAHCQEEGYAVLLIDLKGHGANQRQSLSANDSRSLHVDLQAAYLFLVDRHNRGEFNIAKLGAVGLGESANLILDWAARPGGAIASEGRTTDLAAIVLVSPLGVSMGQQVLPLVQRVAPRIPILVVVGERDPRSMDVAPTIRGAVERQRGGEVAMLPSALHGYKLIQFLPATTETMFSYFDHQLMSKLGEWEPRYLLDPVEYEALEAVATPGIEKAERKNEEPAARKAG